jgi:hypothetical protein
VPPAARRTLAVMTAPARWLAALAAVLLLPAGPVTAAYAGPQPLGRPPGGQGPTGTEHRRAPPARPAAPLVPRGHLLPPASPGQACVLQVVSRDGRQVVSRGGRQVVYRGGPIQPCDPPLGVPRGLVLPAHRP